METCTLGNALSCDLRVAYGLTYQIAYMMQQDGHDLHHLNPAHFTCPY